MRGNSWDAAACHLWGCSSRNGKSSVSVLPPTQESSLGTVDNTHLGVVRGHLNRNRPGGYLSVAFQGNLVPILLGLRFSPVLCLAQPHPPTPTQCSNLSHNCRERQCFRQGGPGVRRRRRMRLKSPCLWSTRSPDSQLLLRMGSDQLPSVIAHVPTSTQFSKGIGLVSLTEPLLAI